MISSVSNGLVDVGTTYCNVLPSDISTISSGDAISSAFLAWQIDLIVDRGEERSAL